LEFSDAEIDLHHKSNFKNYCVMENEIKKSNSSLFEKGIGFGLILVIAGALLLAFNFGALPHELKRVVFSWQMLLIAIGTFNLFKRQLTSGIILILVGTFFIIPRIVHQFPGVFPGLDDNFTSIYWPLLLIIAGAFIIISRYVAPEKWSREFKYGNTKNYHQYTGKTGYSHVKGGFEKNSIFGSGQHIVLDPEFQGGEINAIFGGVTLDLRKTSLPEGISYLEINAIFGGVTLYVPAHWLVEMSMDSIFGGFEDKRMFNEEVDTTRKLVVKGSCVFGGGELRN
jgi:predicted membrane protein